MSFLLFSDVLSCLCRLLSLSPFSLHACFSICRFSLAFRKSKIPSFPVFLLVQVLPSVGWKNEPVHFGGGVTPPLGGGDGKILKIIYFIERWGQVRLNGSPWGFVGASFFLS